MKLVKNAKVFSADGKEIGRLTRYVIDPRSKNVTNIVFEHGMLTRDEYIVPMRQVDHIDDLGIHLNDLTADQVSGMAHFMEEQFVVSDEETLLEHGERDEDMAGSYYYYPGTTSSGNYVSYPDELFALGPATTPLGNPHLGASIPGTGEPPVVRETKENIPEGTVALNEGAKVFTRDIKHVGDTDKVLLNSESGQATHMVISKGVLLKERKLIPINWVDNIAEDRVYLAVDETFVNKLPDYKEE